MKNFINIGFNGYPESNVDAVVRGFTKNKELVVFSVSPDEGTIAALHGTKLKLPKELSEINDLKTLINFLKSVSITVENNELKTETLPPDGAKYMKAPLSEKDFTVPDDCTLVGCLGFGGICSARFNCGADGCAGYGMCTLDTGCGARACALDMGCITNVACAADACAGHGCAVDACPANVNVGPCAIDIPVCPIIL